VNISCCTYFPGGEICWYKIVEEGQRWHSFFPSFFKFFPFLSIGDDVDWLGGEGNVFPSFFSRAYHTRISQLPTSESDHHVSNSRNLPQFHPLLVRHSDHPQQVVSRAVGTGTSEQTSHSHSRGVAASVGRASRGGGGGGEGVVLSADSHQNESVMQQLLSNISATPGTNDVLGFGVGGGATSAQRSRGRCENGYALPQSK